MQRYARANDTQLTRLLTGAVLGLAGLRSPESITVVLEWRQKLFLQDPGIHVLIQMLSLL
jgi:hypothetical protein